MKPHPNNFCGGAFQDWLEVMLTSSCNASCQWCIEKNGWHPETVAPWQEMVKVIKDSGKTNILLLGGEPTLYPDLFELVNALLKSGRKVYITTNGSMLTASWVSNLIGLTGINISIHHYDFKRNCQITGLSLDWVDIIQSIKIMHGWGCKVRFNCNAIAGQIDNRAEFLNYIETAKSMGVDEIRLAELKNDDSAFVDVAKMMNHEHDLTDNPFLYGCNINTVINEMPINFRLMCGLQTPMRDAPLNPERAKKEVLYYDGKMYQGWQEKERMIDSELNAILEKVAKGLITVQEAKELLSPAIKSPIGKKKKKSSDVSFNDHLKHLIMLPKKPKVNQDDGGCQY